MRHLVTRRGRVENRPTNSLELDLNPRVNIRTAKIDIATLRFIRIRAHDDPGVHAEVVQHQRHEYGVLLIVTDHLLAFKHATQSVCSVTRARLSVVFIRVEAFFLQVALDRAGLCKIALLGC